MSRIYIPNSMYFILLLCNKYEYNFSHKNVVVIILLFITRYIMHINHIYDKLVLYKLKVPNGKPNELIIGESRKLFLHFLTL